MDRRDFIITGTSGAATLASMSWVPGLIQSLPPKNAAGHSPHKQSGPAFRYLFADVHNAQRLSEPEGMRVPFNWASFVVPPVGSEGNPLLKWNDTVDEITKPCSLRFSVALDVREEKQIEVLLAESEEIIGRFDIRYAPVHQIQDVPLEMHHVRSVLKQGVKLRMKQGLTPLWLLSPATELHESAGALLPHLMIPGTTDPLDAFYDRMFSLDSIQQFGWMEGCVTDALWDLSRIPQYAERARRALYEHINMFLDADTLVYENPRSEVADNTIYGVECTLPFAAMAMVMPDHPSIDLAVGFWLNRYTDREREPDVDTITAEGSYTVGYPMMVVGQVRKDEQLINLAIERLRIRRDFLKAEDALFLRRYTDNRRTFRNWARGIAWYMLGLTRSLLILDPADRPDDLTQELEVIAEWAISHQLESGLWRCFVDERGIRADTSGSAGIAAALAMAAGNGLLPSDAGDAAKITLRTLADYLTDDGLLTAIAQSNRAGERLQRDDYRVIYQMGMGLMGQLAAALEN